MMKNVKLNSFLLAGVILISAACEDSNQLPDRDYQLVWADEFDGATGEAPNADNWSFEIGTGNNGWGNNELQYYTNRPQNAQLDGKGNLVITARNEPFSGSDYTSARLITRDKREYKYGRVEARLKTPFSQGLWPAFWMLGNDLEENGTAPADTIPWPRAGEIDIMELRGQEPSKIAGTIHGPGYSAGESIGEDFQLLDGRFDTEFHVFAVEWGPGFIDFFVDNNLYQRLTPADIPEGSEWVFDNEFFLILNVAVGGGYVGNPTENSRFPQTMTVDYVRVYQ